MADSFSHVQLPYYKFQVLLDFTPSLCLLSFAFPSSSTTQRTLPAACGRCGILIHTAQKELFTYRRLVFSCVHMDKALIHLFIDVLSCGPGSLKTWSDNKDRVGVFWNSIQSTFPKLLVHLFAVNPFVQVWPLVNRMFLLCPQVVYWVNLPTVHTVDSIWIVALQTNVNCLKCVPNSFH